MSAESPVGEDDFNAWIDGQLDFERVGAVAEYLDEHPVVAADRSGHAAAA